jgi:Insertion element 4 transposase N-terminal/Transposase DDE domain
MAFRVRELDAERKFCDQLTMAALQQVLPMASVEAVLHQHGALTPRHRKLSLAVVTWVVIAMHLYTHVAIGDLLAQLAHGLRFIWPVLPDRFPTPGAFTYRRYQLGARPLAALFQHLCCPIATPETPGAFLFGLRLMAIDGTVENLPDTPHNVAVFGRWGTDRGAGAFPQVQSVYLCECGTHAIVDAGFWPCHTSERVGAKRLLRSVGPGMLVMWDRGLHSYAMVAAARRRGAHVLSRLPANLRLQPVRRLPDGSWLCWLEERDDRGRTTGERMRVRLIEYTLDDPGRPGHGESHRLITTLRSWQKAPAHALVCAYHERWEIETTIDEQQVHQRLALRPLRSHKPVGVIQELYGLLIGHYLIRCLMHEAALAAGVDPDRISFVHALRVIGEAISDFEIASPALLPGLYARLLRDIAAGRLPERRNRSNPRVVKRKMSNFALKRAEHRTWPRPTRTFLEAVRLI